MQKTPPKKQGQKQQESFFPDAQPPRTASTKLHFEQIVAVMVPRATGSVSGCYDYGVPPELVGALAQGDYVRVPLARQTLIGVVWAKPRQWQATQTDHPPQHKLRAVTEKLTDKACLPPLPEMMRDFVDWVAAYTLSPPGQVLRQILPPADSFQAPAPVSSVRLSAAYLDNQDAEHPKWRRTPAREKILTYLAQQTDKTATRQALSTTALAKQLGVSPSVVKTMIEVGLLEAFTLPPPLAFATPNPDFTNLTYSDAQAEAIARLQKAVGTQSFQPFLLDGVTGSGKTEVYFEAISAALAADDKPSNIGQTRHSSLIILPEIALTTQFLKRFEARFGCAPAIWHSGLTPAQRRHTWRAVARGEVSVLVGARSALFLPWQDLSLVVVDEEHDAGFKQEEGVIYNARDMAVVAARLFNATIILSSATPALETVVNAQDGRYEKLVLPARHGAGTLPEIELLDMRLAPPPRGHWLAPALISAMQETLAQNQQALLFLNRRGYAPLTLCRACGHRYACSDCDSWLVEHRFKRILSCHQCGYERPAPDICDACGETDHLAACGPGVERITEEVGQLFPDKRITVLSSDLIQGEAAMRDTLARITRGETDIIVGTQIIAKGHHFPKLGFVGVVDADLGMGTGDLRAGERTFQMLSQVTGRAGREQAGGKAILQSYMPDHPVLQALASGDRDAFFQREIEMRQQANMPPFGRLAGIILACEDLALVNKYARALAQHVPIIEGMRVLGPAPAPIARIRGAYRLRFLVQGARQSKMQDYIRDWLGRVKKPATVKCAVDIDPYRFL
ncbi:MAG: primosomal protein N' [Parvibaculales bacterium]